MNTALYDVPGPVGRRRVRIASAAAGVLLLALLAAALRRFAAKGQLDAEIWQPFTDWAIVKFLLLGMVATIRVALIAIVLSTAVGTAVALLRLSHRWVPRAVGTLYVQFFRSVPVLLLILFSALGLPKLGVRTSTANYLVIGLTLYNSAVIAEIVRSGVLALPTGQTHAALAIGLRRGQVMRFVLLPQAVRAMLPAMVSQLVTVLKDTSLGFVIGYEELLRRAQLTGEFYRGALLPAYLVSAALYIAMCFSLSRFAKWLSERNTKTAADNVGDIFADEPV